MPTLMEVFVQNLNIWLQNMNSQTAQLFSILNSALAQYISIIMSALEAVLPPS